MKESDIAAYIDENGQPQVTDEYMAYLRAKPYLDSQETQPGVSREIQIALVQLVTSALTVAREAYRRRRSPSTERWLQRESDRIERSLVAEVRRMPGTR